MIMHYWRPTREEVKTGYDTVPIMALIAMLVGFLIVAAYFG